MKKIILTLLLFCCVASYAQISVRPVVNEEWVEQGCIQGDSKIIVSDVDPNGNFVYTTSKSDASNSKIYLSCRHSSGPLAWENALNTSGLEYGVDLQIDDNGNIYILGSKTNGANSDIYIAKFTQSGALVWNQTIDLSGGNDNPRALFVDANSNVLIVAQDLNQNNGDINLLKLTSNSGSILWSQTYDYQNSEDDVTSVIEANNIIFVLGVSTFGNKKGVRLLKYNSSGNQIGQNQFQLPNKTFTAGKLLFNPISNKLIASATVENLGNGKTDGIIGSMNLNLSNDWYQTIDLGNNNDELVDFELSADGNIIFLAHCEDNSGIEKAITSKIAYTDGSQIWMDTKSSKIPDGKCKPASLKIDLNGNISVITSIESDSHNNILVYNLSDDGSPRWLKEVENSASTNSLAKTVNVYQDVVYATSTLELGATETQVETVKYKVGQRSIEARIINGVESHVKGEIIVRFDESMMNPITINKIGYDHGVLPDFVDASVVNQLQMAYPNISWEKAKTYKIFKRMTMNDSISISRTGDQVKVTPFWTVLLISVEGEDESLVCDVLNNGQLLFPNIKYAHTNGFVELTTANDPLFPTQNNFSNSPGSIDVDPGWNYSVGGLNVKVGVYDLGLKWDHEDFGGPYSYGNCPNCKVKGGWDYEFDQEIYYTANGGEPIHIDPASNGHGTKVAGVIGALRNNNIGIAGIGGGNWPFTNPSIPEDIETDPPAPDESMGVALYGFRVVGQGLALSEICEALIEGTLNTTTEFGYGLHIMNNSWKRTVEYGNEVPISTAQNLMKDCQRDIFRNQTINVCARGNEGNTYKYFPAYSEREEWVISVGGNSLNIDAKHPNSSWDGDVDVLAPYYAVPTATNNGTNTYSSLNGTSGAAAHVSGLASLMLSHINDQPSTPNNLAPDDVEFLIQRYATEGQLGNAYDNTIGWGVIDVAEVMNKVDRTNYIIKHINSEFVLPLDPNNFLGQSSTGSFGYVDDSHPAGQYQGTVYELEYTLSNNLNAGDVILDSWPLNSYTTTLDYAISNFPSPLGFLEAGNTLSNVTLVTGTVKGSIIHLTQAPNGSVIDDWYPYGPGETVRMGYTLHIQSSYASVKEEDKDAFQVVVYPNPSNQLINLVFELNTNQDVSYTISDVRGRNLSTKKYNNLNTGKQFVKIDVSNFAMGVYYLKVKTENNEKVIKFIVG